MKKLLYLEWLKFSNHRGIKIGLILYTLLFVGGYFAFREIAKVSDNPVVNMESLTVFPLIWELNGYIGNWLAFIILGFIGIQMVSVEFSNKTFRQNVISGLERKEFWASKLLSALAIAIGATLFYILFTALMGLIYTEFEDMLMEENPPLKILYFFLMSLGYILTGMFVAFLVRKGTLAIFVYFIYGMFIENIIRWAAHAKLIPNNISMHFYPINVLEDLTPLPYFSKLVKMGTTDMQILLTQPQALIGTLVYMALFVFLMYRIATRKDI